MFMILCVSLILLLYCLLQSYIVFPDLPLLQIYKRQEALKGVGTLKIVTLSFSCKCMVLDKKAVEVLMNER